MNTTTARRCRGTLLADPALAAAALVPAGTASAAEPAPPPAPPYVSVDLNLGVLEVTLTAQPGSILPAIKVTSPLPVPRAMINAPSLIGGTLGPVLNGLGLNGARANLDAIEADLGGAGLEV